MCRISVALEGHANVLNRLSRTYGQRQHENMKWEGEEVRGRRVTSSSAFGSAFARTVLTLQPPGGAGNLLQCS